jgi:hypothetical protein
MGKPMNYDLNQASRSKPNIRPWICPAVVCGIIAALWFYVLPALFHPLPIVGERELVECVFNGQVRRFERIYQDEEPLLWIHRSVTSEAGTRVGDSDIRFSPGILCQITRQRIE